MAGARRVWMSWVKEGCSAPKVERAVSCVRDDFFRGERFHSLDHGKPDVGTFELAGAPPGAV